MKTKNNETRIQQTQKQAQETFEFKLTKTRESFSKDIPSQLKDDQWIIGYPKEKFITLFFQRGNKFSKL